MLRRFLEMPEAGVLNLLDPEEFGSQQVSQIEQPLLGALVHLIESLVSVGSPAVTAAATI